MIVASAVEPGWPDAQSTLTWTGLPAEPDGASAIIVIVPAPLTSVWSAQHSAESSMTHRDAALQIKREFEAMPQPAAVRPRLIDLATRP
jgi:hypothetical protein